MEKLSTYRAQYEEGLVKAARSFKSAVGKIDEKYVFDMRRLRQGYEGSVVEVRKRFDKVISLLAPGAAEWGDSVWEGYAAGVRIPVGIRFGTGTFRGHFDSFEAPLLVPILNQGNLVFLSAGAAKKTAIQALQSSLLRIVATFPPAKQKLILIDPVGLGANVAGFMHLPEQIMGSKAWTEPRDIEQQLADLTAHMENVIQKYLRNDYANMEEYNRQAGEIAEPYRFLAIINFPTNFTDESAKRLVSIATNGPRSGVYVLCTVDGDLPLPYGFNLPDLLRTGSVVESGSDGRFVWRVPGLEWLDLRLDKPPGAERFKSLVSTIKPDDRVEVPYDKVCPPEPDWWQGDAGTDIKVPLGRRGARDLQYLEFGRGMAHHGLLIGKTGAGKSNLLHVLITSMALRYSPEQLVLYLVDFKEGVEFKDYADYELPHARVIGIESEREFGLSVLREVEQEIGRRGELFKAANAAHDLQEYRRTTGEQLARIILIVDEFQRLFAEDDSLADQASQSLAHIVQQGRVFGINVLLAAQTLADAYAVGRPTYDQMSVRIALQSTEADSRQILGEDNAAARLLNRPGEAVYNAQNGLEAGNNFFQVAWLPHNAPNDEREKYLQQIRSLATRKRYVPAFDRVVFDGHRPSQISANADLWNAIRGDGIGSSKGVFKVYLGESTEINPPHTTTYLRPQGRANLLVVGQSEKSAFSVLSTIWLSLAAQSRDNDADFIVVDFSRSDDPWATVLPRLSESLGDKGSVVRPRDFESAIAQVDSTLSTRVGDNGLARRPSFLFLAGLHRARPLRDTDKYGSAGETGQAFARICRDGPDLGIHVIGWCDTVGNLNRIVDRQTLAEFDLRVAMQMGEDDSNQFVESPKAKSLGQNRAYLYDIDQVGRLEKFRPYEFMSDSEFLQIKEAFGKRKRS